MAHIFKWKAIYRIIKNQRNPQIEEKGRQFSEEYAALLGSCVWCLTYLVRTGARNALRALTEKTLRSMLISYATMMINFLRAYGFLIKKEVLDALRNELTTSITAASSGTQPETELTQPEPWEVTATPGVPNV